MPGIHGPGGATGVSLWSRRHTHTELASRLAGLTGAGLLAGLLAGWLAGWLPACLPGWLAGWPAGQLAGGWAGLTGWPSLPLSLSLTFPPT